MPKIRIRYLSDKIEKLRYIDGKSDWIDLRALNEDAPIESITLIGLCTDICVISNALLLRAYLPEIPIIVDAACCAGVTPESHRTALAAMRACQIIIENEPSV